MQSKRDQVQAHMFVMGRLNSGMLLGEPDAPESPLARTTRGLVTGVVIAVLISAGAFVVGLLSPGGKDSWRSGEALVVNKDTGARYLYLGGRLRPVRNYASALLLGGKDLGTVDVGSGSLDGTPIGVSVGIDGAPDSVPGIDRLERGAWRVCSVVDPQKGAARTVLVVGGGHETETDRALGTRQAVLLVGPDRTTYLMWRGSRLRLDTSSGAVKSLGYGSATPRPVSSAFLDSLPAGPDLASPDVPGRGELGPSLAGAATKVGQLFRVQVPGGARSWYVLGRKGLEPLTDTAAALLLGDPRTRQAAYDGQAPRVPVVGSDVLGRYLAPGSAKPPSDDLPASPPSLTGVPEGQTACAVVEPGSDGTRVSSALVPASALAPLVQPTGDRVAAACSPVDGTVVRAGRGALVRALGAGGGPIGDTVYLVTESGVKYRVAGDEALTALGYSAQDARALPSPLLAMLPTGPDLSPDAASGATTPRITAPDCSRGSGQPRFADQPNASSTAGRGQ
ncbi:type VII secretion protein EccB [Streptomyces luteolifulvus]|uniref:Type VII secretion protein EccB n=1 Tax=Streptomyces luteolifulvus TaxID=2615112 RepID=A0A6H9URM8_9ACTN|nr:type VII secretion protein EccB [Streptomyces luteolifulvus]KAB1140866.1 type VII secretion protein EccB [Streptomyces luteolifulvus]